MTREQLTVLCEYIDCSVRRHTTHILAVVGQASTAKELEVKCTGELYAAKLKLIMAFALEEEKQ